MSESGGERPASWWWAVAIVAALLPIRIDRAAEENTLWTDEIHSLAMSRESFESIIGHSAMDRHPPLYYLLLKVWCEIGDALALLPPLLWARSMNVVVWAAMVAIAFAIFRRLGNGAWTALPVLLLAANGTTEGVMKEVRGYAIGFPAVTLAIPMLFLITRMDGQLRGRLSRRAAVPWLAYGGLLALALWSHLLAGVALLMPGLLWLALARLRAGVRSPFVLYGAAAHAIALLSFAPWMLHVREQVHHAQTAGIAVHLPATFSNALRVAYVWSPMGPLPVPPSLFPPWLIAMTVAAVALPAAVAARAWKVASPGARVWVALGACCIIATLANAFALVAISHFGIPVFFPHRYTVFGSGWYAVGIGSLCIAASGAPGALRWLGVTAAIPFVAAAMIGTTVYHRYGSERTFRERMESASAFHPRPGDRVQLHPVWMARYVPGFLSSYEGVDLQSLLTQPDSSRELFVLRLKEWSSIDTPEGRLLDRLLMNGLLSEHTESIGFPQNAECFRLFRLQRIHSGALRERFGNRFDPRALDGVPQDAVAAAHACDQVPADGWFHAEFADDMAMFVWGTRPRSTIRFDKALPPGRYALHIRGFRHPHPSPEVMLKIRTSADTIAEHALEAGAFTLVVPVTFDGGDAPRVRIDHPTWRPSEVGLSQDGRRLSWMLHAAWIEPLPEAHSP